MIKKELADLSKQAWDIVDWLKKNNAADKIPFGQMYQAWYTKSSKAIAFLVPDRVAKFRSYYEPDPKRKDFNIAVYVIQDFVKGFEPTMSPGSPGYYEPKKMIMFRIINQVHILESASSRIDSILANAESILIASFVDEQLENARQLGRTNLRAAGALAGVVLEGHLQRVARAHSITIQKKDPTIGDLNDPLRTSNVYDVVAWRKIQYLADIRNICSHQKNVEPTKQQIAELLDGVNWALKSIG